MIKPGQADGKASDQHRCAAVHKGKNTSLGANNGDFLKLFFPFLLRTTSRRQQAMVTHLYRRQLCTSMARLLLLFSAVGPVTVRADLIPADLCVNGLGLGSIAFAPFPAGDTLALTWVPTQQRESTFPRPLSTAELHTDQLEADGQIAYEIELAAEQAIFPSDSRSDGKTTHRGDNGSAANTWTSGKVASTTPVYLYQGGAPTSDTATYYLNKTVVTNKTVLGTCLPCCREPQPGTQVCCCPPPGCAIPPSCPPPPTPPSAPLPPFALSPDTTYKFRVRIYTAASATPSAWSAPASFDTAPSKEEWAAASWIGGGSELRTDLVLPPSPIKRARA